MGLTGTADSGVPLSPGLVQDPGASPVQGVAGDGAAGRPPEPEPDLSLPSELPPPPEKPCSPDLQVLPAESSFADASITFHIIEPCNLFWQAHCGIHKGPMFIHSYL